MKKFIVKHKVWTAVIILALIGGGYYVYAKNSSGTTQPRYILGMARIGTVAATVTGTGQVANAAQLDIKPKVSGDITSVPVKIGDHVTKGAVIATIDATDALKAVRDARVALQDAQLSLDKLTLQHVQTVQGDSLNKSYEDGMTDLATTYSSFSSILTNVENIYSGIGDLQPGMSDIDYYVSRDPEAFSYVPQELDTLDTSIHSLYKQALAEYETAQRGTGDDRAKAISDGYQLVAKMATYIKTGRDPIRALQNELVENSSSHSKQSIITSQANSLDSYGTTTNTNLSNLLSDLNSITALTNTNTQYPFDNQSQVIAVEQKQNALADAEATLADYTLRAPFDGIVAAVNSKMGDTVSAATTVATLITQEQQANITLNELDIPKVKNGQKAVLTFDALPGTTFPGTVTSVDILGTVTQGVVSYGVTITLDQNDDRIRPGMSVSAVITTDSHEGVLVVPTSAVKSDNRGSYVQELTDAPPLQMPTQQYAEQQFASSSEQGTTSSPRRFGNAQGQQGITSASAPVKKYIQTGLSNDTLTEVVSGLDQGERIVVRTITPTTGQTSTTASAPSLFGGGRFGGGGGGGGAGGANRRIGG